MPAQDPARLTAVVIPVFGALSYARRCLESLARSSPAVLPIIVDDATPDLPAADWWQGLPFDHGVTHVRFPVNRGLTAAWNEGVRLALRLRAAGRPIDTLVLGNSDLLFPLGWQEGIQAVLMDPAVAFCGPMTNAPGNTQGNLQDVRRLLSDFEPSDDREAIDQTSRQLQRNWVAYRAFCDINGFCMAGGIGKFLGFANYGVTADSYRRFDFFPPRIERMPSGRINPWPRMAGQESWLNHRVKQQGLSNAAACGSFVWHYRSITRGGLHKGDKAYRPKEQPAA